MQPAGFRQMQPAGFRLFHYSPHETAKKLTDFECDWLPPAFPSPPLLPQPPTSSPIPPDHTLLMLLLLLPSLAWRGGTSPRPPAPLAAAFVALPPRLSCAPPHLSCAPPHLSCAPPHLSCAPPHLSCAPPHLSCAPPHLSCAPPRLSCAPPRLSRAPPAHRARAITARERPEADGDESGASMVQSSFNLVKNVAGAGVLSLPAGVAAGTGLAPALAVLLALGAYSAYTFTLLGRLCEETGQSSFKGLGEATIGPRFGAMMDATCTLKTFFTCLAYSLVLADSSSAILAAAGAPALLAARPSALLLVTLGALLPLCLLKQLAVLSYTSLLGVGALAYTTAFMVARLLDGSYAAGGVYYALLPAELRPSWGGRGIWHVSMKSVVLACSLSTAFIAHYNAPKFYASLRRASAERFSRVAAASFGVAIALFTAVTCAGYLTFGSASQGLILNNYATCDPLATAARVAIASSIVFTYPLAFTGLRDGVQSLFRVPESSRLQLTSALLATVTALALVVRDVGFVNNLGGSIFGALIIYIFPGRLFLAARRAQGVRSFEQLFAKITIGAGVLLAVLGSAVTILKQYTRLLG